MCKSMTIQVYRAREAEMSIRYKKAKNKAYEEYLHAKYVRDTIKKDPTKDLTVVNKMVDELYAHYDYINKRWSLWKKENYSEMQREVNKSSHNI